MKYGWGLIALLVLLLGGACTISYAELDRSQSEASKKGDGSSEAKSEFAPLTRAELEEMPLEELREREASLKEHIKQLSDEAVGATTELNLLRREMLKNEDIRVIRDEIKALEAKIDETVEQFPEVISKRDEVRLLREDLTDQIKFRMELMQVISQKSQDQVSPK